MSGLEGVLAAHESTGIKGTSWDELGGMRQSCSCGWEQNYAGRNDHGWGLHRAHIADALREWLLSEAVVDHVQNFVPLGFTDRDPYDNTHEAALAILTAAVEANRASEGER